MLLGIVLGVSGSAGATGDLFKTLQVERFTPPRPAKLFALSTLEGRTTRLADFRGKVVVLNFWATWCPACREEMPSMERLHHEFKDRGFVVVAVDLQESRDAVAKFMKEFGLTFPALLDLLAGSPAVMHAVRRLTGAIGEPGSTSPEARRWNARGCSLKPSTTI